MAVPAVGVFAGGFTLEAAEAVAGQQSLDGELPDLSGTGSECPVDAAPAQDVLALMSALVDKSLVQPAPAAGLSVPSRFGMLETIREFALEQLAASGEIEAVSAAHAAYFVTLVETFFPRPGMEREGMLDYLAPEVPNLRGALAHLVERRAGGGGSAVGGSLAPSLLVVAGRLRGGPAVVGDSACARWRPGGARPRADRRVGNRGAAGRSRARNRTRRRGARHLGRSRLPVRGGLCLASTAGWRRSGTATSTAQRPATPRRSTCGKCSTSPTGWR